MNMYTTKDLREEINWMSHKAVVDFLDSKGIKPVLTRKVSRNTYRFYDEAALIKCKELRVEREREQGLIKPVAPVAPVAPTFDAMQQILDELRSLHAKIDAIAAALAEQDVTFDDDSTGGTD